MAAQVGITDKAFIIAALDFGSTFSAYAYTFKSEYERDRSKLYSSRWEGTQQPTVKAPTIVLFEENGTFNSFGYEAESRYAELAERGSHVGWRYFRYFKMSLYEKRERMLHMKLVDEQKKKMPAREVFSAAIKYLADHLLTSINNRVTDKVSVHDIEWYLTVPAIWTDGAKQFMQVAAGDAGLPEIKVSLALEPEAAAVYIRQIGVQKGSGFDIIPLAVKSKFMVIDLGGGTVDMTFHEVSDNQTIGQIQLELDGVEQKRATPNMSSYHGDNRLVEIHAPEGGKWGGNLVNEDLEDFMSTVFTESVWDRFSKEPGYKEGYLDLCRELESAKKKDFTLSDTLNIKIPGLLIQLFRKVHNQEFENYINDQHVLKELVTVTCDKLRLKTKKMVSMFNRSIDSLIKRLNELDETLATNAIDIIVLVGGFSASKVVQKALKEYFSGKTVIIPEEPSLAVLRGVSVARPFDPAVHPERYRVRGPANDTKGDRAENIFEVLISAGSVVYPGETKVTRTFNGSYSRMATEAEVSVYISPKPNPKFIDEEGCSEVGSVEFSLQEESVNHGNRFVDVTMHFGHTKIFVIVFEKATGKVIKSSFNCLN